MNFKVKLFVAAAIVAVLVASPVSVFPQVNTEEWDVQQEALSFIRDVVRLDLAKYDVKLTVNRVEYPSILGGLGEERVEYSLKSANLSELNIMCTFINKELYGCIVWIVAGSPILIDTQPANTLTLAKQTLQRFQNFSKASDIQTMRALLDSVNDTSPTEVTSDNVKLVISVKGNTTRFDWIYSVNDFDFTRRFVSFTFENGLLTGCGDSWNLYTIGSAEVNVSREQVIEIARECAKNYTLRIWQGEYITMNFTIVDEPVEVQFFDTTREPLTLYQFWKVQLYFDKLYGTATGIEVGIWADTGKVEFCQATGISGDMSNGDNSTTSPEASSTLQPSQTPTVLPSTSPEPTSSVQLTESTVTPITPSQSSQPSVSPSQQPTENTGKLDVLPFVVATVAMAFIVALAGAVLLRRKRSI